MNEKLKQDSASSKEYQSQIAVGLFLIIFSFTILIAFFFTETTVGKVTNVISGIILLVIGLGFGLLGWRRMRTLKE